MIQTLIIPNRLPGMNDIIAAAHNRHGNFSKYAEMKKRYGLEIILLIKTQCLRPITVPVDIDFHWYEDNIKGKKRDKDNISAGKKFVLDALVDSGIIRDDDWKQINTFTDHFHSVNEDKVRIILNYEEELCLKIR